MLKTAISLLEEKNLLKKTALGGGTALSAVYWQHRYSTDIDMFIYGSANDNALKQIRPGVWSKDFTSKLYEIGNGHVNVKNPAHYIEISLSEDKKIQFFDVLPKTQQPYHQASLWGYDINIESVDEIIAKKIFYRADKGNSRDIFDIAVALYHNPDIFFRNFQNLKSNNFHLLLETCREKDLDIYTEEILLMNPKKEYQELAMNAIEFVCQFTELYIYATAQNIILDNDGAEKVKLKIMDKLNIEVF